MLSGKVVDSNYETYVSDHLFMDKREPVFIIMTALGIKPYYLNKEGKVTLRWCSWRCAYSGFLFTLLVCMNVPAFILAIKTIKNSKLNYEDILNCSNALVVCATSFMPFITFCECGKLLSFIRDCELFETAFNKIALRNLPKMSKLTVNIGITVVWGGFCIYGTAIGVEKSAGFMSKHCHSQFSIIMYTFLCYLYVPIVTAHVLLWKILNDVLTHCAENLMSEIELNSWAPTAHSMTPCIHLWHRLRELYDSLGSALWLTNLSFFSLMFLALLPTMYGAARMLTEGNTAGLITPLTLIIMVSYFLEMAHRSTSKGGKEFRKQLTKILLQTKPAAMGRGWLAETEKFIEIVDTSPPTIPLAGFIDLDRRANVSMYSSLMTYFIIIVQFRGTISHSITPSLANITES